MSILKIQVEKLKSENETMEAELAETTRITEELERDSAEQREAEAKRRADELSVLKKSNQMIKVQLLLNIYSIRVQCLLNCSISFNLSSCD